MIFTSYYNTKLNDKSSGTVGALLQFTYVFLSIHLYVTLSCSPVNDISSAIIPIGVDFRYKRILFNDRSLTGTIRVCYPYDAGITFGIEKAFDKSGLGIEFKVW